MIIKRRGVEYWLAPSVTGSDPQHPVDRTDFPAVEVVEKTVDEDDGRDYLLLVVEDNEIDLPTRLVATPARTARWVEPRRSPSTEVSAWDVTLDPAYAAGISSGPLPPPGPPLPYLITDVGPSRSPARPGRGKVRRGGAAESSTTRPPRQPDHLRPRGWDCGEDRPPFAQITAAQRFVGPDGERDWLLLHVVPHGTGTPPRVLVTSSPGPMWDEPQPEHPWSDDDGFVAADAWDVSEDPAYAEPADSYPVPAGRPWSSYNVFYPSSGPRPATVVRDVVLTACLVALSPLIAIHGLLDRRREKREAITWPPAPLPEKPPPPSAWPGPAQDDDLALRGALRSGKVRLVARALSRGTVLVPAGADEDAGAADRGLHVFSSVSVLDAWVGTSGRPYAVIAGDALVALAALQGADVVSLDAGSDHHLEISTEDLVHHLGAVGAPRSR